MPIGEDGSFAKKSVVAKRNRYKDKYPCTLFINFTIYIIWSDHNHIFHIMNSNRSKCYTYTVSAMHLVKDC